MNVLNRNINNIYFIFALSHLMIWTLVPSLTNKNLSRWYLEIAEREGTVKGFSFMDKNAKIPKP